MVGQHGLDRREAVGHPVPHPLVALGLWHVPGAVEVLQHAQVVERVDVAGNRLGYGANALAIAAGRWQKRRTRPGLIKVFQDRQRLSHHAIAMLEHRHQLLRIELAIRVGVLLAAVAHQMHRNSLVGQALQVQSDAHPVSGTGAPVGIQHQLLRHLRSPVVHWNPSALVFGHAGACAGLAGQDRTAAGTIRLAVARCAARLHRKYCRPPRPAFQSGPYHRMP